MRVAQRLFLAVLPAVLGLFTVAALAYWGQVYRRAPEWVVVVAAVAAVGSLAIAWANTRYVARRIERLASPGERGGAPGRSPGDELASIEQMVDHLSDAVTVAETGRRQREVAMGREIHEYATLLAEASAVVSLLLDEVRVPLHILLENHFGTLNENQEEMLAAARTAAEAADIELRRLREIADLDRGALSMRRDPVRLGDLLQALSPQLLADGEPSGVTVVLDVEPGLPRLLGDRVRLQQALELLLRHLVRRALPGAAVTIRASREGGDLLVTVENAPAPTLDADVAVGHRIVLAHGGRVTQEGNRTAIRLPAQPERAPVTPKD